MIYFKYLDRLGDLDTYLPPRFHREDRYTRRDGSIPSEKRKKELRKKRKKRK